MASDRVWYTRTGVALRLVVGRPSRESQRLSNQARGLGEIADLISHLGTPQDPGIDRDVVACMLRMHATKLLDLAGSILQPPHRDGGPSAA